MHQDDLKTMWICHECQRSFIFNSDIIDHTKSTGHSKIITCDFPKRAAKKGLPDRFVYGKTTMNFRIDGKPHFATLRYKYYPSKDLIQYTEVIYTDPTIEKMVEKDPTMIKKIDAYIRRSLENKSLGAGRKIDR